MKKNKNLKVLVLAGVLTVGLGAVGCSKKNEEAPKEPTKQEQQVEKKLTVEDLKKMDNVSFEDLENVAKNQFGKGSEKDGKSQFIAYREDINEWVFIQNPSEIGSKEPNIKDVPKEKHDREIEIVDFLCTYYTEFKKMNDEFIKQDLTKDGMYDKYMNEYDKWNNLINGSYIESESAWGTKTLALVYEGLGNERDSITEMINMSNAIDDESERKSEFDKLNKKRLEKRVNAYDSYLIDIYSGNMKAIDRDTTWNF